MRLRNLPALAVVLGMTLVLCPAGWAQSPIYGLGKAPTAEEIRAWDIAISPDGKELPPGNGTAKEGAPLFTQKCAACHGANGYEGRAPQLIKIDPAIAANVKQPPCLSPCIRGGNVMALHSPYATTIWDYINRGMPFGKEGSLKPDEVYALTAYLLYKNGIIPEDQVLDAKSLPQIKMPNHDGYVLPEWKHGMPRPFPNKP
jgi:S-disulfanyl-L-cysteine oxidoreductase SoxD